MLEGGSDLRGWKVLTLLLVGVALLWETRPAYGLAYTGVLLFFLFQSWQRRVAGKLDVKRSPEEHFLFPGDSGVLALHITNPTSLPLAWISVYDGIPGSLRTGKHPPRAVFSLGPRADHEVCFQITARDRGVYRLGPLDVFVGDFFGISTQALKVDEGKTVVVFPKVYELGELALPARLSFGSFKALQPINPDPTRLAGLRRYQEGDQLRSIHWPATARTQTLQVKQFDHTVTATCVLFLDLHKEAYKVSGFYAAIELAIATTASLASHLILRGEACGMVSNAVLAEYLPDDLVASHGQGVIRMLPRQGTSQLTQIMTVLAGVQPQQTRDFLGLLRECTSAVGGATILLWVVPRDTPELIEQAWKLAKKGRQVQIFVVEEVCHQELLQRPLGSALQVFSVSNGGRFV
jgi:uncharacterized protein (DUF58 family)